MENLSYPITQQEGKGGVLEAQIAPRKQRNSSGQAQLKEIDHDQETGQSTDPGHRRIFTVDFSRKGSWEINREQAKKAEDNFNHALWQVGPDVPEAVTHDFVKIKYIIDKTFRRKDAVLQDLEKGPDRRDRHQNGKGPLGHSEKGAAAQPDAPLG